jgi:Glycosyltransferase
LVVGWSRAFGSGGACASVSERVKECLVAKGVRASKIEVISVAQDLASLLARSIPSVSGVFTFVVPCRFVEQKGLDVFIEAFDRLFKQGAEVRARLIGSGYLERWLRQEVQRRGLDEVVEISSWVSSEELWDDADALVVASRYEGWGRTIVEAMAAGVPVVTTEVGCVGSFFRPGVDGLAVPVGDVDALVQAMRACVEDGEGREARCKAAREQARTFPVREDLHDRQREGWGRVLTETSRQVIGPRFELWVIAFVFFAIFTRILSVVLFHAQL